MKQTMEREWVGGLESLRKRRERDEDCEIERIIREMYNEEVRVKKIIQSDKKPVCIWQLIDGRLPDQGRDSKVSHLQTGPSKANNQKYKTKQGKSLVESDGTGSTASNSSTDGVITTSHSFKSRGFSQKWKEKDTKLFFKALSVFGTDFSMVALLFRGRDRSQLINKYHKEERDNPGRVELALKTHRQGGSKVMRHCNRLLSSPNLDETSRCRVGSASSLDSLDMVITAELGNQIMRSNNECQQSFAGSSGQPI